VYQKVYHSSQRQGLIQIEPRTSTHGVPWVYACWDRIMSAVFLGTKGGDFTCAVGRDHNTGLPYICERFEGALNLRYKGVSGSIYTLPGATFEAGMTSFPEEVVSEAAAIPVHEEQVADAKQFLLGLGDANQILLVRYPDRVAGIPQDDQDLVEKAALWIRQYGDRFQDQVKRYHPSLVSRVLEKLDATGH